MCEVCEHTSLSLSVNTGRYDPTRTITLRNEFVRESNRRFDDFARLIKSVILEKDVFGLKDTMRVFQELPKRVFEFRTDPQKVVEFERWLDTVIEEGLIGGKSAEQSWLQKYIQRAYLRGVKRAWEEMERSGFSLPFTEEFISTIPLNIDVLELLYTRTFTELKGITAQMGQQISRILAQGFIDKESPAMLAKKLVAAINGKGVGDLAITDTIGRFIPAKRRAEILARTEIVRAHHLAMIEEYKRWGIKGVTVKAEWVTAGDDRVCQKCANNEGKIFTLDEIRGLIPFHPLCRCICLPVVIK